MAIWMHNGYVPKFTSVYAISYSADGVAGRTTTGLFPLNEDSAILDAIVGRSTTGIAIWINPGESDRDDGSIYAQLFDDVP